MPKTLLTVLFVALLVAGCAPAIAPTPAPAQPTQPPAAPTEPAATAAPAPTATLAPTATPAPTETPAPTATPEPMTVWLDPALPADLRTAFTGAIEQSSGSALPLMVADDQQVDAAVVHVTAGPTDETVLAERFYAVVAPFDTVTDDITLDELKARWAGTGGAPLYVTSNGALLDAILGEGGGQEIAAEELRAALEADRTAVGIAPFDLLDPRYKVLTVDGSNVLSNALDPATYPLAARVTVAGPEAEAVAPTLAEVIAMPTNRDPAKLTTLIMTGVTAMARNTARVMEEEGVLYPALVISPTLAAADITHISNEIPFLENCKVNATKNNLVLCSSPRYWETLEAVGADIIGLSGNHVNDFGRKGARESLQFYKDNNIPIYGSGLNIEEACKPLMWEHNGNTFAFIAALAYWPEFAWATETEPGACYYYDNKDKIKAMVEELSGEVDVVAVELQYYETYNAYPTIEQVKEFREIRGWGADLVTGVQSHVPQAHEPYGAADPGGPGFISYGLGNFFFDQMWSWETRTELYDRHTIYDGRLLSTEILTGVLENYAQPRWTAPKERADLLNRIFKAAPELP
jgi:poly-gamma-glutamate synthesis protein (capsule biosynthesis protein)